MRRRVLLILVAVAVLLVTAGMYWFQPWKLFTSKTVNDAVPAIVTTTPGSSGSPAASAAPSTATAVLVRSGTLISHEHDTSGTAQLIRLPDGHYQLVLQNLSTSDGPDLRV